MNRYSKRNLGNEKISSNINNDNDNIEEIFNENDNSFTTLKINNIHQRRRYERKTLRKTIGKTIVFEETLSQHRDEINKNQKRRRQTVKIMNRNKNNPMNGLSSFNKNNNNNINNVNEANNEKIEENNKKQINRKRTVRKSIIISKKMLNFENKINQKEEVTTNSLNKSKSKVDVPIVKEKMIDNDIRMVANSKTMDAKKFNKIEENKRNQKVNQNLKLLRLIKEKYNNNSGKKEKEKEKEQDDKLDDEEESNVQEKNKNPYKNKYLKRKGFASFIINKKNIFKTFIYINVS
jgi:hypothetical protein